MTGSKKFVTVEGGNGRNRVQIWFRAPKVWDDFLEAKATEEFCTKSDLLRHAFRQVFGSELKEFRANGVIRSRCDSCAQRHKSHWIVGW